MGETETVTAAGAGMTVRAALSDFVGSALLVTVTATARFVLIAEGAVYKPDIEILPDVGLPPTTPLASQAKSVPALPVATTLNCKVLPACRGGLLRGNGNRTRYRLSRSRGRRIARSQSTTAECQEAKTGKSSKKHGEGEFNTGHY